MRDECESHGDMCFARASFRAMKMIQLRNAPEDLHRRLKARVALEAESALRRSPPCWLPR